MLLPFDTLVATLFQHLHPTKLNWKMQNSEKGLIQEIQPECAVYITQINFGILSYSK